MKKRNQGRWVRWKEKWNKYRQGDRRKWSSKRKKKKGSKKMDGWIDRRCWSNRCLEIRCRNATTAGRREGTCLTR